MLRKLNEFIQPVYFFCRSRAAFGFVQQPKNVNKKRSILTNAKLHCGKKYLLNIDLKDFFHQISRIRVTGIFHAEPFCFNTELSSFLSELTTYHDRLPMGSPTSPSLSNFATRELDEALLTYSTQEGLLFSRYVDDLTFSSNKPISDIQYYTLQDIVGKNGFSINMDKTRYMNDNDEKTVTGLILKERPVVPAFFLKDLEDNINRLKHVNEFSSVLKSPAREEGIQQFGDHIKGKLRFLQMVYGQHHPIVTNMNRLFQQAYNTNLFTESFSWNNFPYS